MKFDYILISFKSYFCCIQLWVLENLLVCEVPCFILYHQMMGRDLFDLTCGMNTQNYASICRRSLMLNNCYFFLLISFLQTEWLQRESQLVISLRQKQLLFSFSLSKFTLTTYSYSSITMD